jgi:hypothetical protein
MKKVLCILFVLVFAVALTGCGVEIADTNGPDDTSLATITEENIINMDIGSSGLNYTETEVGALLSSEYSSKNFNGVERIYLTNFIGKSDIRVYIGHMNVESGNFKLVVVNNEEIIHEFALDTFGEEFWFEDLTGEFAIHVAGESAEFDFHIQID